MSPRSRIATGPSRRLDCSVYHIDPGDSILAGVSARPVFEIVIEELEARRQVQLV